MPELLILLLIIFILLALYYKFWAKPPKTKLYDRLEGIYKISEIVNYLGDSLFKNSNINKDLKNKIEKLSGFKFMFSLFIASISQGPFEYPQNKFDKFSKKEFDILYDELEKTLDHYKIPEEEKKELLTKIYDHKKDIINE